MALPHIPMRASRRDSAAAVEAHRRRHECRRGTQECVRHKRDRGSVLGWDPLDVVDYKDFDLLFAPLQPQA